MRRRKDARRRAADQNAQQAEEQRLADEESLRDYADQRQAEKTRRKAAKRQVAEEKAREDDAKRAAEETARARSMCEAKVRTVFQEVLDTHKVSNHLVADVLNDLIAEIPAHESMLDIEMIKQVAAAACLDHKEIEVAWGQHVYPKYQNQNTLHTT